MNTPPSQEETQVLLVSPGRRESDRNDHLELFKKNAPHIRVKVIPSTLFDVNRYFSGEEAGVDEQESEVLSVVVPKYKVIILGTSCIDEPGVVGNIPRENHPLSEFADLCNNYGREIRPEDTAEKMKGEYLEKRRKIMKLLLTKIRAKQPGALIFWIRECSGAQWSREMQPRETVLEFYPEVDSDGKKYNGQTWGREWIHTVSQSIASGAPQGTIVDGCPSLPGESLGAFLMRYGEHNPHGIH